MHSFSPQPIAIAPFVAEAARQALGKIFWGTLICVFDFHFSETANGSGFRIDVISDVVGAVLIAWGIAQLVPFLETPGYAQVMRFCFVIAVLAVLDAVREHIIAPWPAPLQILFMAFGFACVVAIYYFCGAMRAFCLTALLMEPAESWNFSRWLVLLLNLIPSAIFNSMSLLFIVSGDRAHFNIGPLAIVIVIAAFVPLVHILISIWRTRRALEYTANQTKFA